MAFSLEEVHVAGAHGDPREDHHQDPQRRGNKSDPSFALSSLSFSQQLLPPSFFLTFTSFTLLCLLYSPLPLPQISPIIHLPSLQCTEEVYCGPP